MKTIRVGLTGLPGSGKTTLARGLAANFVGKNVEISQEYARKYINKYGFIKEIWEQQRIMAKQLEWETNIPSDVELFISDSPIQICFAYSQMLRTFDPENFDKENMLLNDMYELINKLNSPSIYDVVFYLPLPFEGAVKKDGEEGLDDGTREPKNFEIEWQNDMEKSIIATFETVFPSGHFIRIESNNLADRTKECDKILRSLKLF